MTDCTKVNVEFRGRTMDWMMTVSRQEGNSVEAWQFTLSHDELTNFSERLQELLDTVEQRVGEILRGQG